MKRKCCNVTELRKKYSRQWWNLVQSTAASHKLTLKSIFAGLSGADWYTKNFRGSCQLAVLPEPVLSTRVRTGMEKQQEYRYSAVADDDSDITDLRAFRPGDNLNHIHWNLSLRTDDLIVRQYGEQIDVKK